MDERMSERVNDWMTERLNEWTSDWLNDWTNEWPNEWTSEWLNEWTSEWMNDWMNEWMTEWLNDWTSEWANRRMCKCLGKRLKHGRRPPGWGSNCRKTTIDCPPKTRNASGVGGLGCDHRRPTATQQQRNTVAPCPHLLLPGAHEPASVVRLDIGGGRASLPGHAAQPLQLAQLEQGLRGARQHLHRRRHHRLARGRYHDDPLRLPRSNYFNCVSAEEEENKTVESCCLRVLATEACVSAWVRVRAGVQRAACVRAKGTRSVKLVQQINDRRSNRQWSK
jgi:hypothetical protein